MNKVYLIGNLTRDPEMRATQSGISVCNFSIAVNRRVRDAQGNQQTDFFNIVAWRQLADLCGKFLMKGKKVADLCGKFLMKGKKVADLCGKFLMKGKKVAVVGSIQTRTYEAQDGSKRTTFDIVADEVEFISPMGEAPGTRSTAPTVQPEFKPADNGFTQVDDDELPF